VSLDSYATLVKVTDLDLADCELCKGKITIETDKKWVVCNVYEDCCIIPTCVRCKGTGRRWDRIECWHPDCYDRVDYVYGDWRK
jgi:hypothetical protein